MTDLRQAAKTLQVEVVKLKQMLEQQQAEPVADDMAEQLADALDSAEFYRRRVDALQAWQSKMRDPERIIVCDILANGHTLDPAFAGDRYITSPKQQAELVAWDVFELRLYGAPQEKQHRVLWVDRYTQPDGSTPDLDGLLEAAKTEGGIDGGAKTLHVRPLYAAPPQRKELSASEILNMMPSAIPAEYDGPLMEFARAVEAKLKEGRGHD